MTGSVGQSRLLVMWLSLEQRIKTPYQEDSKGDNAGAAYLFGIYSAGANDIFVDGKTDPDTGNVVLNYAVIPEPCYLLFIIYYLLFINYFRH